MVANWPPHVLNLSFQQCSKSDIQIEVHTQIMYIYIYIYDSKEKWTQTIAVGGVGMQSGFEETDLRLWAEIIDRYGPLIVDRLM